MERKNVRTFILLAVLGLSNAVSADVSCDEQLVVFGDSLSDTGNVFVLEQGTFPPSPPYAGGRFTDGLGFSPGIVWVEYLADMLGLQRPAARLTTNSPSTNYAFGGAVTGSIPAVFHPALNPETTLQGGLPLDDQVGFFLKDVQDSTLPSISDCGLDPANSLFVVWIGSNDILLLAEKKPKRAVQSIRSNIEKLIEVGATQFLVANTPDLSSIPGVTGPYSSLFVGNTLLDESPSKIEKSVIKFNTKLSKALDKIEKKNPEVSIHRFDVFSLLSDVQANPESYGFNSNTATPLLSEEVLFLGQPGELIQNVPGETLFWDGVHPNSNAHAVLAEAACRALDRPDATCELGW